MSEDLSLQLQRLLNKLDDAADARHYKHPSCSTTNMLIKLLVRDLRYSGMRSLGENAPKLQRECEHLSKLSDVPLSEAVPSIYLLAVLAIKVLVNSTDRDPSLVCRLDTVPSMIITGESSLQARYADGEDDAP